MKKNNILSDIDTVHKLRLRFDFYNKELTIEDLYHLSSYELKELHKRYLSKALQYDNHNDYIRLRSINHIINLKKHEEMENLKYEQKEDIKNQLITLINNDTENYNVEETTEMIRLINNL